MTTVREYNQYAKQCPRWAAEATTQEDRKAFLDLARDWTLAAARLEEGAMSVTDKGTGAPIQRTA
jgi:hypothetical protein